MSDYIERQAVIDAFNRIKNTLKNPETAHYDTLMFYEIEDVLEDVEPADVVQVVRCKDCEWAMKSTELPGWYMCKCEEAFDYYAKPDDFCSYGKKREEEE